MVRVRRARTTTPTGRHRYPREDVFGSAIPSCASSCIAPAESQSGCQSGDNVCLCTTADFLSSAIKCAAISCSEDDAHAAVDALDNDCRNILHGDNGEPGTSATDVSTNAPSAASQTSTTHEQSTSPPTTSTQTPPLSASSTSNHASSVPTDTSNTPPSDTSSPGSATSTPPSSGGTSIVPSALSTTSSAFGSTSNTAGGAKSSPSSTPSSSSGASHGSSSFMPASSSTGAVSGPATSANAHKTSPTLVTALSVSLGAVVLLALCLSWILFRRRRRQRNGPHARTVPYSRPASSGSGNVVTKDDRHAPSSGGEAVGDALSPTATSRSPEERPFVPLPSDVGTALLESPTIQSADTVSSPILIRSSDVGQLGHAGSSVITAGASRCSVRPLPDPSTSASPAGPELTRREMGDYEKASAPLPEDAANRGDMSTQYAVEQETSAFVQEGSHGRRRLRMEPILIEEDFTDDEQPPPYEPRA